MIYKKTKSKYRIVVLDVVSKKSRTISLTNGSKNIYELYDKLVKALNSMNDKI